MGKGIIERLTALDYSIIIAYLVILIIIGYRASFSKKIKSGEFPKSYPLGPRAVGWLAEDVEAWIDSRIQAAGGAK